MSDIKAIGGTVRSRAAAALRTRILAGRLPAGSRIDLDETSREFGISRTPVREALLELSYEGLVAVNPRSGITVLGISPDDAVDNFAILATLAGKAAEWATHRMTPESMAELRRLAVEVETGADVVTANRRFHQTLNRAARSPRLLTHLRQAISVVPANYFELFPEQEDRSRTEHAELLEAIEGGDPGRARTVAEAHVLHAGEALGDWLREQRS